MKRTVILLLALVLSAAAGLAAYMLWPGSRAPAHHQGGDQWWMVFAVLAPLAAAYVAARSSRRSKR